MLPCKHDTFLRRTNKKQLTHLESTAFFRRMYTYGLFCFCCSLDINI